MEKFVELGNYGDGLHDVEKKIITKLCTWKS